MTGREDTQRIRVPEALQRQSNHTLIFAGQARGAALGDDTRVIEIGSELEIGRGRGDGSAPRYATDDPHMSRRHALFRGVDAKVALVRDLGSRNGTLVDGGLLDGERPLRDGAVIFTGASVFVYRRLSWEAKEAIAADRLCPLAPVQTISGTEARLCSRLKQLARSNVEVLLSGETGVGKEVLAEAIHRESGRRGPFVAINCAALPDALLESELFGYARGAHSTAEREKPGLIERAKNGTLFLDEIGEMSAKSQAKLLRFLQDRQFLSLGTIHPRTIDVRVVAATRREITHLDDRQGVRLDLAARLGPEPFVISPLRDRPEDIGLLSSYFLRNRPCVFDIRAYRSLFLRRWLGNIRELRKVLEVAAVLSEARESIEIGDLSTDLKQAPAAQHLARERPSSSELETLLQQHHGNVGRLARKLGRQRTLVWRWLRNAGLDPAIYRTTSFTGPSC